MSSRLTWARAVLMLDVAALTVAYGELVALRDVSLRVNQGEIVTVIGSNGAGKTTLLRTVSGLLRPRAGAMEFLGQTPGREWQFWFGTQNITYQLTVLPGDMRVCAGGDGLNVRASPERESRAPTADRPETSTSTSRWRSTPCSRGRGRISSWTCPSVLCRPRWAQSSRPPRSPVPQN